MEIQGSASCDDEVLVSENTVTASSRRVWPYLGVCALVFAAGWGGHSVSIALRGSEVVSFDEHYSWVPAWHHRPLRFNDDGCTWDGDDCRHSRCCAQAGSRCWRKNSHWASCNETCHYNVKWEADRHHRGYWAVTHHQVWSCEELIKEPTTTPTPVVETVVIKEEPSTTPKASVNMIHDLRSEDEAGATEQELVGKIYPKKGEVEPEVLELGGLKPEAAGAAINFIPPPTV